ncbi:cation-translocating P-type ATPase [Lentisalinibacter salinarum]|uniref:cation-translocating P-type ATPase n=1 Tax=Lentisalinibacter salinarum TaxID=2992239 RepID=UPI0038671CFF
MIDADTITGTPWHALPADEALDRLESDREGLGDDEVGRRQEEFGPNELPREGHAGLLLVVLRQFRDPLIYILLIAGSVSLAIGSINNALFIFAVLALNAGIGAWQEYRAETSAAALREALAIRVRVRRDGREREVPSGDLVPGDVVLLEAGDSVPADIRLLRGNNLHADESMLTGESLAVPKDADAALDEDTPLGERETLVHAGSAVVDGKGEGVVCRTGTASEVGRIAESLSEEDQAPPLVLRLRRFTRRIAILVLAAVAILSVVQFWRGAELLQIFYLGVALAVSAIPAGLPVAITVALSIASSRMAARHVIVRQLQAVEGLGACTLVASDKTGTLTANVLTAKRIVLPGGTELEVEGEGYGPEGSITDSDGDEPDEDDREALLRLATAGVLCNEGELRAGENEDEDPEVKGDSVDIAFLVLGAKLDLERQELLEDRRQTGDIPFESSRRYAASFHAAEDGTLVCVKGAAEVVSEMCSGVDGDDVAEREAHLAERGYRVLAVAAGRTDSNNPGEDDLAGLDLLGLVALIDPVRPEVPEAIERCHSAGVEVRMITGDHPRTGLAIARELGIAGEDDEAVTGRELKDLEDDDPEEYDRRIARAKVFARVEPTQKTDIVARLQEAGHFVAVTGDGVNDAPALKGAHIGVAMGEGGTDVARGAAALILTDDNFASIVHGIEEGRGAYDNVRKVTWLLLATGAGEVLLFFLAIFAGLPLPLNPVQLLWLNLVTNGIQDVALAFEKTEPGVLERKPRSPDQPIFDRLMIRHTLTSGLYIGGVAFAVYYYLIQAGYGEYEARNLLLLLMVLFENVHAFSCRSERRSAFRVPLTANLLLVAAVVAAHGVHIGAMFVPGLSDVLGIGPVSAGVWLTLLPIAVSLLFVDEIAKLIHRRAEPGRETG